jgi:hypothetical protein
MLLDNIKDLIKEMEEVLMKNPKFKEDINFKNMVKTIYTSNSSKLKTIYQIPSYDITPIVLSNLSYLGKPTNVTKSVEVIKAKEEDVIKAKEKEVVEAKEEVTKVRSGCDKVINDLKLVIAELIKQVKIAHEASRSISVESTEKLAEIERLFKEGKYKSALELAKSS